MISQKVEKSAIASIDIPPVAGQKSSHKKKKGKRNMSVSVNRNQLNKQDSSVAVV